MFIQDPICEFMASQCRKQVKVKHLFLFLRTQRKRLQSFIKEHNGFVGHSTQTRTEMAELLCQRVGLEECIDEFLHLRADPVVRVKEERNEIVKCL